MLSALPDALDEALIVHCLLQCQDDEDLERCGVLEPSEPVSSCTRNASKLAGCCTDSSGACTHARYRLSFGLLIKAKAASLRVCKHNLFVRPRDRASEAGRLAKLVLHLTCAEDRPWLLQALEPLHAGDDSDDSGPSLPSLSPRKLLRLARELTAKTSSLGPGIQKVLQALPLRVRVRACGDRESLGEDRGEDRHGERSGDSDDEEEEQDGESEAVSKFLLLLPVEFVSELRAFFRSVQRPDGTFAAKDAPSPPPSSPPLGATDTPDMPTAPPGPAFSFARLLPHLVQQGRETCPSCQRRRSIYCGDCLGQRMPQAALLLPPRVPLPFDLVLLLHPAESLGHCTGIHAAVMGGPHQVQVLHWPRTRDVPERLRGRELQGRNEERDLKQRPQSTAMQKVVGSSSFATTDTADIANIVDTAEAAAAAAAAAHYASRWSALLDAIRPTDLLLFPAEGATLATDFDWTAAGAASRDARPRVIVLEASWNNSKSMHRLLVSGLQQRGVVLRTIVLTGLVGSYWKFHYEGNSAVGFLPTFSSHRATTAT